MNEALLVMFQVWQGIPGINSQVFPATTWERGHFLCFSNFQNLDYRISKNVQANPCGFIRDNKKGLLTDVPNFLKYMEPNGRGNDYENSQFLF